MHQLIPKHTKLSETEKKSLLKKHGVTLGKLPKIFLNDAAITSLKVAAGDIIKIERTSKTAGTTYYYRVVIDG